MEHWEYTKEIKDAARRKRRQDDSAEVIQGLEDNSDVEETAS
jgi:hypothetical protein